MLAGPQMMQLLSSALARVNVTLAAFLAPLQIRRLGPGASAIRFPPLYASGRTGSSRTTGSELTVPFSALYKTGAVKIHSAH